MSRLACSQNLLQYHILPTLEVMLGITIRYSGFGQSLYTLTTVAAIFGRDLAEAVCEKGYSSVFGCCTVTHDQALYLKSCCRADSFPPLVEVYCLRPLKARTDQRHVVYCLFLGFTNYMAALLGAFPCWYTRF